LELLSRDESLDSRSGAVGAGRQARKWSIDAERVDGESSAAWRACTLVEMCAGRGGDPGTEEMG
jgi:hypothetical protein